MLRPALVVALLAASAPALAHPGHGEEIPWCAPGDEPRETQGDSAARLAKVVLHRGSAGAAARMIAREARTSATAAMVLADALEELGDSEGARVARRRAAGLPP